VKTLENKVIVSLFIHGKEEPMDFLVPTDVKFKELKVVLRELFADQNKDISNYKLELKVVKEGYVLKDDETLADANVWEGAQLRLGLSQ